MRITCCQLGLLLALGVGTVTAADLYKLPKGTPELQSAGPLAFGPDGLLFIGDNKAAAIVAIQTGDKTGTPAKASINIDGLNVKLAEALSADSSAITINDLAANPASGNVYLSLTVSEKPVIARIDTAGKISAVPLKDVGFSRAALPNAPEDKTVTQGGRPRNNRANTITDLAFVDGQVIVSGMSSASSPSNVRTLSFPFDNVSAGSSLEIYHAAHGKSEDYAAIRTFVPMMIDGKASVLAGFVCTPLVRIDLSSLQAGEKVKGTTVAELGNRNQPLDMIAYKKDGQDWLLLANSARGVMKISTADLEKNPGLTQPVTGGGTAGQSYETIESLKGVVQLDRLNDENAVIVTLADGATSLRTIPLP